MPRTTTAAYLSLRRVGSARLLGRVGELLPPRAERRQPLCAHPGGRRRAPQGVRVVVDPLPENRRQDVPGCLVLLDDPVPGGAGPSGLPGRGVARGVPIGHLPVAGG